MKYADGQKVLLGDKVDLGGGMFGVVVCSLDDAEYASEYPESKWGQLKEGVLIKSEQAGLIHYVEANEDFLLVERAKPV